MVLYKALNVHVICFDTDCTIGIWFVVRLSQNIIPGSIVFLYNFKVVNYNVYMYSNPESSGDI